MQEIPYGYCHCGCGQKTNLAKKNCKTNGNIKGEPFRYKRGHGKTIPIDIGSKFGRLTVEMVDGKYSLCICDCGTKVSVLNSHIRAGNRRSCGCLFKTKLYKKHGHSPRGKRTLTYRIWCSMRERCNSPRHPKYKDYGGRGITVCERWQDSFANFIEDMGEKPEGLSIERKNNDLGYSPENCVWATRKEQSRNKRNNVFITHLGKTQTRSAWAEELGIEQATLYYRQKIGWSVEDMLSK